MPGGSSPLVGQGSSWRGPRPAAAYELSKVEDPAEQARLAVRVVSEGLSRAETIEAVRRSPARTGKSKGRGAAKGRKVTSRVFRKQAGCTVTVENSRGLDRRTILEALESTTAAIRAEIEGDDQVAA